MKKVVLIVSQLMCISALTNAAQRIVNIDAELSNAKISALIIVESYTDSSITMSLSNPFLPKKLLTAKLKPYDKSLTGKLVTGGLPDTGIHNYFLVVIDSNNYVSLFAKPADTSDYLIFWSPVYTGDECIFRYGNNFQPDTLSFKKNMPPFEFEWKKSNYPDTIKECRATVVTDHNRLRYNYPIFDYTSGLVIKQKKFLTDSIEYIFALDFADERGYEIENVKEFKKLDGKKIIAFGKVKNDRMFEITEFRQVTASDSLFVLKYPYSESTPESSNQAFKLILLLILIISPCIFFFFVVFRSKS